MGLVHDRARNDCRCLLRRESLHADALCLALARCGKIGIRGRRSNRRNFVRCVFCYRSLYLLGVEVDETPHLLAKPNPHANQGSRRKRNSACRSRSAAQAVSPLPNSATLREVSSPGVSHEHEHTHVAADGAASRSSPRHSPRLPRCRKSPSPHRPPKRGSPSTRARRRWIAATPRRPTISIRTAVAADPNFTYAWVNLSNVTFSTEEFNAALKGAEQGAAKASEGERMLLEFNKLFLTNNFDAQLALAKQLTDKYPNAPRAWMVLAARAGGAEQVRRAARDAREGDRAGAVVLAGAVRARRAPIYSASRRISRRRRSTTARRSPSRRASTSTTGRWATCTAARIGWRTRGATTSWRCSSTRRTLTAPIKLGHVNSFLGHFDEARKDYDRGIAAGGPANAGFLAPFKCFTWVYAGEPAKAVQSLEKLVADIDGFGARQGSGAEREGRSRSPTRRRSRCSAD